MGDGAYSHVPCSRTLFVDVCRQDATCGLEHALTQMLQRVRHGGKAAVAFAGCFHRLPVPFTVVMAVPERALNEAAI